MNRSRVTLLLLTVLFAFSRPVAAEPARKADSLRKLIAGTDDQKKLLGLYLAIAKDFEKEQPDSASMYLVTAHLIARQIDEPSLLGEVYYAMGNIAVTRDQLDLALSDYRLAAGFYHRAGDDHGYARMLMLQGNIMGVRDNAGAAMTKFLDAIGLAEKTRYNTILSHLYNNTGDIYQQSGDYGKAMFYYNRALQFFILNNDSANLGIALVNIGMVYFNLGNPEMARHYNTRALAVFQREKDTFNSALCLMNLGMIESSAGNCLKAMDLLNRSLDLSGLESQDYAGPKSILRSEILIRIGINFLKMNDNIRARDHLLRGFSIARTVRQPRMVMLAAQHLSMAYENMKDDRAALQYYKMYHQESDSLSKVMTVRSVELTEIRQDYLKKQQENELKLAYVRSGKRTMLILYIVSGIIFLAAILILFLLLKLEKQKKKQANLEKTVLDEKLDFQNKEMTSNVLYLNKMNEQVVQIAEKLKNLSIDEDSPNAQVIRSIIRELAQDGQEDVLKEFEVRFQNVHSVFYRNLTEKYPDLTPNELKLCAFLRLNMSTKEISALTYQSENSIMVARTRLRHKLKINRNENLVAFLSHY